MQQPTTQLMHAHHLQVDETEFERLVEADAFEEELSGSDSDGEAEEGEEGGGAPVEGRARLMLRDATGAHLLLWRAVLGGQMFGAAGTAGAAGAAGAGAAALVALRQLASAREPPPVWVIVLCRGGHFAAAAFELRLPPKGAASRRGEECVKLLARPAWSKVPRPPAGLRARLPSGPARRQRPGRGRSVAAVPHAEWLPAYPFTW